MPLLVPPNELRVGTTLHEPLVSDGRVMLQGGKTLTDADIDILNRRFPGLSVRIADPLLDSEFEFEDDSRERQVALETQQRVAEFMTRVQEQFSRRSSMQDVTVGGLDTLVRDLTDFLRRSPVSAALITHGTNSDTYFGTHAGNVFYLSMLLALKTMHHVIAERRRQTSARSLHSNQFRDLVPLGLGAVVADIGMLPLQHLLDAKRPLTAEESEALRQHPLSGADTLPESFSAQARTIVRAHHENYCGSGYPKGVTGDKVHVFARIIRIVDAFDAATSERVHRGAKSPVRALWEMTTGPYRRFYDPELMRAFATIIQPFPIGARLCLSDGRCAVVVKYNRQNPLDPTVVIAFDANKESLPREQLVGPLNLGTGRDLCFASIGDEDLSFLYGESPQPHVRQQEQFTTALQAAYP